MPGQDGVLQLGQHGVVEAEHPGDQRLPGGDAGGGVPAELVGDRHRLPAGGPQVAEGARQVVRAGRVLEGRSGHGASLCPPSSRRRSARSPGSDAAPRRTGRGRVAPSVVRSGKMSRPPAPRPTRPVRGRRRTRHAVSPTGSEAKEDGVTTVEDATVTPVAIRGARGGPDVPTLRQDRWWVQPLVTVSILIGFVVYATWAAFANKDYYVGAAAHRDLLSPFYSPCLRPAACPAAIPVSYLSWWDISPALLILIVPLGFRLTCYYYRRAYYRSIWLSPPELRGGRRPRQLHRRDPVPAHPPERPPVLLLPRPRRST